MPGSTRVFAARARHRAAFVHRYAVADTPCSRQASRHRANGQSQALLLGRKLETCEHLCTLDVRERTAGRTTREQRWRDIGGVRCPRHLLHGDATRDQLPLPAPPTAPQKDGAASRRIAGAADLSERDEQAKSVRHVCEKSATATLTTRPIPSRRGRAATREPEWWPTEATSQT